MARYPRRSPDLDDAWLQRAALTYLRRFAATTGRFRRVMLRKVDRAIDAGSDAERDEVADRVESLIGRLTEGGYLDDERLVRARVEQLHQRGTSRPLIRARLAAQEAPPDLVAAALEALSDDGRDPELEAAIAYARRRRLGPWSREPGARRDKELGSMGRAGFGYGVACRVLDAGSIDELEELVERP